MDWTVVATTGISAVAGLGGATLGFWGAVRQGQSEVDRQREQHREDERRHRQAVYHQLLDLLRVMRFATMGHEDPLRGGSPMTEPQFQEWRDAFMHVTNGAQLFGTPEVAERVEGLLAAWIGVELGLQFMASTPEDTFAVRLKRAWEGPPGNAMMSAQADLLVTMRADVATDGL